MQHNILKFESIGDKKIFNLTIEVARPSVATLFGGIAWSHGTQYYYVTSPIVVGEVKG